MKFIATNDAPKAIGPYSQAISANGWLFTSGQIPLDPATGDLIDGDFQTQVRRVFANLEAVLRAAGTACAQVVTATVYLTELSKFQTLNSISAEHFGEHKPARTTVGVRELPKGAQVEIDLVALV